MPTAKITLNCTSFLDISTTNESPRWCVLGDSTQTPPVPKMTLTPDPSINNIVFVSGNTISTTGNAAIIFEFTISSPSALTPLGIAFQQTAVGTGGNAPDEDGSLTFNPADLSSKSANKIKVNNNRTKKNSAKWKFYILVQRTSDRALGIIDPDVQNDN
ncbi:MAG: hypothetical protein FJ399_24125 [Verrucomicrobia bacterium]|nr:hypothetical protein [Verrucomicrobiota bacterium]